MITSHYHGTTYAKYAGITGETVIRKCVIDFIKPNVTISSPQHAKKLAISSDFMALSNFRILILCTSKTVPHYPLKQNAV